ncbi:MAG TPA: methyltransferase domain-containing protein, partial [Candidatus Limnocylindrales bacterium]|nr:methyltransferase domain-containing protein [Candidatus Limnocylindrales bacterium]
LWCGRPHRTRTDTDLEGYALLCPDCVGRAGDNEFLRFRLREGLRRRAEAEAGLSEPARPSADDQLRAYYAARAGEYDDWYLRRGRYSRGPIADMAWAADLDAATLWLDGLDLHSEIVELAAGTGWWSPLLAQKGTVWLYDAVEEPLDRARERLLAHGLAAHIHVRDAWAEPDRQVDALFCGFWLSHVPRARLGEFLAICRAWLKPGGRFAFIDSRRDPESGATDHPLPADDMSVRRLDDGREFEIVKVYWQSEELEHALSEAGFVDTHVTTTSRFFLLGEAKAA